MLCAVVLSLSQKPLSRAKNSTEGVIGMIPYRGVRLKHFSFKNYHRIRTGEAYKTLCVRKEVNTE